MIRARLLGENLSDWKERDFTVEVEDDGGRTARLALGRFRLLHAVEAQVLDDLAVR
jgi:hypothetical protein